MSNAAVRESLRMLGAAMQSADNQVSPSCTPNPNRTTAGRNSAEPKPSVRTVDEPSTENVLAFCSFKRFAQVINFWHHEQRLRGIGMGHKRSCRRIDVQPDGEERYRGAGISPGGTRHVATCRRQSWRLSVEVAPHVDDRTGRTCNFSAEPSFSVTVAGFWCS